MKDVSDNFRGAALMMASMAGYVLNDTMVKLLSDDLNLFQVLLLRGCFASFVLGVMAWNRKVLFPVIIGKDWRMISFRLLGEVGATICYLNALFNMPLANATAILQSLPLAVTLGAAVFLKEPVGWRRYLAILVGFAGVMIIVRPGSDGFNSYALSALAAVVFIVLRDLSTRQLSPQVPSLFVAFLTALIITGAGGVLSFAQEWKPVGLPEVQLLAAAAAFLIFGYLFGIMTMRVGTISFVSPFRYTILIWAILLGVVVFSEMPDRATLIGSAVIVVMGIYTLHRERRVKRLTA